MQNKDIFLQSINQIVQNIKIMQQIIGEKQYLQPVQVEVQEVGYEKQIIQIQNLLKELKIPAKEIKKFINILKVYKPTNNEYIPYLAYLNINDTKQIKSKLEESQTFKTLMSKLSSNIDPSQKNKLIETVTKIVKNSKIKVQSVQSIVQSIVKESTLFGLADYEKSQTITPQGKYQVFLENPQYLNYIKPKLIREKLSKSLKTLLQGFLDQSDYSNIDGIINDIISNIDANLVSIDKNQNITLAMKSKSNLIKLIKDLNQFKEFIDKKGGDLQGSRYEFVFTLFSFMSYEVAITSEIKYDIMRNFVSNPLYNLKQRDDISPKDCEMILRKLTQTKVLENYEKILLTKKNLRDKKAAEIEIILQNLPSMQQKEKNLLKGYLNDFKFNEFYSSKFVALKLKEIYKLIQEGSPSYIEAFQYNNIDIEQHEIKVKKFIQNQLIKRKVDQNLSEQILKRITTKLDMSSIQNNKNLGENIREDLIKTIQKNEIFIAYKKIKFQQKSLQVKVRKELENFLMQTNFDAISYPIAHLIIKNLIETKQQSSIMKIDKLSTNDQKTIRSTLVKSANSLPMFKKFKENMGIDLDNLELKLRQTLFQQIKRNMHVEYDITQQLINKIVSSKTFETIKSFPNLIEKKKQQLINFTNQNKECQDYLRQCRKLQIIESEKNLKKQCEGIIADSGIDDQFADILPQLYLNYCIIDNDIDNHPSQDVRELFTKIKVDKKFKKLDIQIMEQKTYQKFYENFCEILKIREQRLIQSFKQTLNNAFEDAGIEEDKREKFRNQIIKTKDGLRINLEYLNTITRGKKQARAAYNAINQQEIFNQIKILEHVLSVRSDLIWILELERQQRVILEHQDFQNLKVNEKQQILQSLKNWDLETVLKYKKLSPYQKQKLIKEIESKKIFLKYILILDNKNKVIPQVRQFIINYTSFCMQNDIDFSEDLKKFIQNEFKVKVGDSQEEFPTTTQLQQLKQKYQLHGSSNFFFGDDKLTSELFEKLKYSQKILNLTVKKSLIVDFNGDKKTYEYNPNQNLKTALLADSRLAKKYFKVYNTEKSQIDTNITIKDLSVQAIRVVLFRKVKLNGDNQPFECARKVSELRVALKGKGDIINFTFNGEVLNQNKTFQEIFPNVDELDIKINFKVAKTVESVIKDAATKNFQQWKTQGILIKSIMTFNKDFTVKGLNGNFLNQYEKQMIIFRQKQSKDLINKFEEQSKKTETLYADQKQKPDYIKFLFLQGNEQAFQLIDKSIIRTPLKKNILIQMKNVGGAIYQKLKLINQELSYINKLKA